MSLKVDGAEQGVSRRKATIYIGNASRRKSQLFMY